MVVIHHQEGFPDGFVSVGGGLGTGAVDDVAEEGPGETFVGAGVYVDVCLTEILGERFSSDEDSTGGVAAKVLWESVEIRVVPHTPSVDLIMDSGEVLERGTAVEGLVDWPVWLFDCGVVVLPGEQ